MKLAPDVAEEVVDARTEAEPNKFDPLSAPVENMLFVRMLPFTERLAEPGLPVWVNSRTDEGFAPGV